MSTITLTTSQQATLAHAVAHTHGKIEWFPDHIKGGARQKVIDGLLNRALITRVGTDWWVTDQGYDALGMTHPAPMTGPKSADDVTHTPLTTAPDMEVDVGADVALAEASWVQENTPTSPTTAAPPRPREGSKQAQVIALLKRPEGASIDQIMQLTQWQSHTVRGFLAGTLKRVGLTVTSCKPPGLPRIYRLAELIPGLESEVLVEHRP